MPTLILAGKSVDVKRLKRLLGVAGASVHRYAAVSRGVRRLEAESFDMAILAPDAGDATWGAALRRVRRDFALRPLLFFPNGSGEAVEAVSDGAFAVFDLGEADEESVRAAVRFLAEQTALERALFRERAARAWMEKTGRMGAWSMDEAGGVTWSDGVRRILGDERGALTADFDSIRAFVLPEDRDIFDQAHLATFEQGWPLDFEYRARTAEGDIRHLHLHRRVELDDGGEVRRAYGLIRDVSEERDFEQFLFRRDAIMQTAGRFSAMLLRDASWSVGMEAALSDMGEALDVSAACLLRRRTDSTGEGVFAVDAKWFADHASSMEASGDLEGFPMAKQWVDAMRRRKVVAGDARDFRSSERRALERLGFKSILCVPVFVGDGWWGVMVFAEQRRERRWEAAELESLSMIADIFGAAVLRSSMEGELKEAHRQAQEAQSMAMEASQAKSRFLANMSHEIRTPISGILGMAEMTVTTGLTAEQREHVDMIREAARSLLSIVNDILDLSKVEADKMRLRHEDFALRTVIENTLAPFAVQAEAKNLAFLHDVDDDAPRLVRGDPERLGQVLRNLLSNAVKFTDRGLVETSVEKAADVDEERGRVQLRFSVRDTGVGIPEHMVDAVFDSFTQVDESAGKRHQGTGLGLAISRELVELMDGEMSVESQPGRGSVFTFTACFDAPRQEPQPGSTAGAAVETFHLNILLAEDNPLNQKFLTHFLTIFGHTVTVAGNGVEALEELKRRGRDIDLVLMDIQMPEMGGVEAARAIRAADGRHFDPDIPVIALTAYAMKGDRERMIEAGMNDYVSKPVDMKALSAAIARCMKNAEGRLSKRTKGQVQTALKKAASDVAVELDLDGLVDRFDGQTDLLRDILELFLLEADEKLASLDEGARTSDPDVLGPALHSIANIASHVMAMDILTRARELEKSCYLGDVDAVLNGVIDLRPRFEALVRAVRLCLEGL